MQRGPAARSVGGKDLQKAPWPNAKWAMPALLIRNISSYHPGVAPGRPTPQLLSIPRSPFYQTSYMRSGGAQTARSGSVTSDSPNTSGRQAIPATIAKNPEGKNPSTSWTKSTQRMASCGVASPSAARAGGRLSMLATVAK